MSRSSISDLYPFSSSAALAELSKPTSLASDLPARPFHQRWLGMRVGRLSTRFVRYSTRLVLLDGQINFDLKSRIL